MPASRPLHQVGPGDNSRQLISLEGVHVMHDHIQAALAAERRRDLLRGGRTDRRMRRSRASQRVHNFAILLQSWYEPGDPGAQGRTVGAR